jgi:hypothetical protein
MRLFDMDERCEHGEVETPDPQLGSLSKCVGEEDGSVRAVVAKSTEAMQSEAFCVQSDDVEDGCSERDAEESCTEAKGKHGCVDAEDPRQAEQSSEEETATSTELMELLIQQEKRCALSGIELTLDSMELGHIRPISQGGTDAIQNLMWIDSRINRMQGTLSNDEFLKLCRLVTQWHT